MSDTPRYRFAMGNLEKDGNPIAYDVVEEEVAELVRLAEAAPDLLAAAERIVARYDERWAASIGEVDDLRVAIRKAKGEIL